MKVRDYEAKVGLFKLGEESAARLLEIHDRAATANFAFFQDELDEDRERDYILRMNESPTDCLWGVIPRGLNSLIGTAGIHEIDENLGTARLGVIIWNSSYHNQGYGNATVQTLIIYAFEVLNLQKVYVTCRADNKRVQKWYLSLGFVEEGVLRAEYPFGGKRLDMIRFGMLKSDWEKANGR